ncbi:hypothetical protein M413DRAFT_217359 [Hebeloma cylindrosporum]|uniref:Uncharacterized protein n=1 Tax=Hebeloma cylindrosporum TaxID=76867 RepID=A0A0C3CVV7_HEBCY|nr:hypothetical protein M413DRAFT_217359 [Hebeloma cylindrosporum h7]
MDLEVEITPVHIGTSIVAYPLSGSQPDELETALSEDPPKRPTRVRFRSRVRITSGLHQHRHKSNSEQDYTSATPLTPSSSLSGSPSSSISAPLRTQAEDEASKPGWGTLGQRVSILAQRNADRRLKLHQQREHLGALSSQHGDGLVANERTPLRGSSPMIDREIFDSEAEMLSRDIDLVFGPWPNRLLNHQWWWWHIEPLVCCRCLTELDEEE